MALYKALVSIAYTETPVPAGSTVTEGTASVYVALISKATGQEVSNVRAGFQTPSYTFTDVAEGEYTVTVAQLDDSGNTLGTPATVDFTVAAAPVATFFAPSAVSVTVTAQ